MLNGISCSKLPSPEYKLSFRRKEDVSYAALIVNQGFFPNLVKLLVSWLTASDCRFFWSQLWYRRLFFKRVFQVVMYFDFGF